MDLKYYRDGPGATVSVNTSITPRGEQLVLRVNGKPDASTLTDRPTQWLVGHIPLLLLPSAKQVLVVGLGSGMTCAAILRHPVERLDVVEISPEVVEAARLFDLANDRVLDHPRAHLILDDARSFLQISGRTYDIVVSQPSNPWVTGMSSLFTREFYLLCRARLDPGGLMAQWVHAYEMDDPTLQLILNTFASVFPSYGIWQTSESDLLLIGVPHDFKSTLAEFRQRFDQPSVRTHLEQIVSLPLLLARELTSPAHPLHTSRHNTRLHTDFHPVLDHAAQRAFFLRNRATFHLDIAERQFPRPRTLLADYLETHPLTETDVHAFVESHRVHGLPDAASLDSLLRQWQHDHPESTLPAELASEINP